MSAGIVCAGNGCHWPASELQQAACHVAHLSVPLVVEALQEECEVHCAGAAYQRLEDTDGSHQAICLL